MSNARAGSKIHFKPGEKIQYELSVTTRTNMDVAEEFIAREETDRISGSVLDYLKLEFLEAAFGSSMKEAEMIRIALSRSPDVEWEIKGRASRETYEMVVNETWGRPCLVYQ